MLRSIVHHKRKLGQKLEVGTEAETGKTLLIGLLSGLLCLVFFVWLVRWLVGFFILVFQDHLQGSK